MFAAMTGIGCFFGCSRMQHLAGLPFLFADLTVIEGCTRWCKSVSQGRALGSFVRRKDPRPDLVR